MVDTEFLSSELRTIGSLGLEVQRFLVSFSVDRFCLVFIKIRICTEDV